VPEARFENFIVHLDLERNSSAAPGVVPLADCGRAFGSMVEPADETVFTSSVCRPLMTLFRRCRGYGLRARVPPQAGGAPMCF
jgi:hypothetical protein